MAPPQARAILDRPRAFSVINARAPDGARFLCVGDTHFPFHDRQRLPMIYEVARREKPDIIVQLGDLFDLFNWFRDSQSREVMTPRDELSLARWEADAFWGRMADAAPKAARFQILGNHCVRILKKCTRGAAELEGVLEMLDFRQLWRFPGVETMPDSRTPLEAGGIVFHHGWQSSLGRHCQHFLRNTVVGHTHHGGVYFVRHFDRTLWELNCGYIADPNSPAMSYTFASVSRSVPGYGWVDGRGPRFVPLG